MLPKQRGSLMVARPISCQTKVQARARSPIFRCLQRRHYESAMSPLAWFLTVGDKEEV